jgi:hypothetical protein
MPFLRSVIIGGLTISVLISYSIFSVGKKVDTLLSAQDLRGVINQANAGIDPTMPVYTGEMLSDRRIAKIAWQYFKHNTQKSTGLVNAAKNYPSTTIWDTASHLIALICAERLQLIGRDEFASRAGKVLHSLEKMKLYNNQLPNKVYHTKTLAMVNYANLPTPKGVGWSAIDMARLMVPLTIFNRSYPALAPASRRVLQRYDIAALTKKGKMQGARNGKKKKKIQHVQEGRLGYEQYSAHALLLANIDARAARRTDTNIRFVDVMGVSLAVDNRDRKHFGANVMTTSESYILFGLEFGLEPDIKVMSDNLLKVQQERWKRTGILTALSEGHLDRAPYFVYNTVLGNGEEWASIAPSGTILTDLRSLSSKAAIGFHALYDTEYTKMLATRVMGTRDEAHGWRAGIYEVDGSLNTSTTVNTNAIILEAMHYRKFGPLLPQLN